MVITQKAPVQISEVGNDTNVDSNLIEGSHLESLDQLDGAFDIDTDTESSDLSSASESDDEASPIRRVFNSARTREQLKAARKRKPGVANESKVINSSYQHSTKSRALSRVIPKYVKLGLFGGSPHDETDPVQQPESTTEPESSSVQGLADSSQSSASIDDNESHGGTQKAEAVSTSDASAEYLIANADIADAEEFITREAEQKPQPTPSENEAANILTSIKSGDLLRGNHWWRQ